MTGRGDLASIRTALADRKWGNIMFEIDKQKFGAFVAMLRKEKGLTQKEMAKLLYISDKAVSKWETGVSIPDTPQIGRASCRERVYVSV